jgi:hypothetical protein
VYCSTLPLETDQPSDWAWENKVKTKAKRIKNGWKEVRLGFMDKTLNF